VGQKKLLIVEDEIIIAMNLRRQLEKNGFEVCGIAGGEKEAVDSVQLHRPDTVLMDINLRNNESGINAANEIRKQEHIPNIIYITGYGDEELIRSAWNTGPLAVLKKPVIMEDIIRLLA